MTKGLVLIESLALVLDLEVNLMQEIEAMGGEVALEGIKDKLSVEILENYSTLLAELPMLLERWLAEHEEASLREKKRRWFGLRKSAEGREGR